MDGRRQRSEDNRARIIRASFDLIREGNPDPSAEAIAARAQVGLRSVYRHFATLDTLSTEVDRLLVTEVIERFQLPTAEQPSDNVLTDLVDQRTAMCEALIPFKTAADVRRARSPFLQRRINRSANEEREMVLAAVPLDLRADDAMVDSLSLILSIEAWRRLRRDQRLSQRAARSIVLELALGAVAAARARAAVAAAAVSGVEAATSRARPIK